METNTEIDQSVSNAQDLKTKIENFWKENEFFCASKPSFNGGNYYVRFKQEYIEDKGKYDELVNAAKKSLSPHQIDSKNFGFIATDITPPNPTLEINLDYQLFRPLSQKEFDSLKESIKNKGQLEKIVVNPALEILDGHHRYKACLELGKKPEFEIRKSADKLDELEFVIDVNYNRRQLNKSEILEIALLQKKIEAAKAKQRQLSTLKQGNIKPLGSNETNGEKGKARDIAAKKFGATPTDLFRYEKLSPELREKVRKKEVSLFKAYEAVKAEKAPTEKTVEEKAALLFEEAEKDGKKFVRFKDKLLDELCPYYHEDVVNAVLGSLLLSADKVTVEMVRDRCHILDRIWYKRALDNKTFDADLAEAKRWVLD